MADSPAVSKPGRVIFLDALRGLTVISMVGFHTCYDLVYLYGVDVPLFTISAVQDAWRCSISWTFLVLAGWMTCHSRSNLRRAAVYGACAALVYLVTSVASVDTAISFGILYCMAACTLVLVVLEPVLDRLPPAAVAGVSLILFALTYGVPRVRYDLEGLAWLGLPSRTFSSGDYYPLVPYVFLYLFGAAAARWFHRRTDGAYPSWMYRDPLPALSFIGRHSLVIYLAHQPLVLVLLELLL